ncbi:hypothetical protein GCM10018963_00410 [Saccharothrix longispora]
MLPRGAAAPAQDDDAEEQQPPERRQVVDHVAQVVRAHDGQARDRPMPHRGASGVGDRVPDEVGRGAREQRAERRDARSPGGEPGCEVQRGNAVAPPVRGRGRQRDAEQKSARPPARSSR